VTLLEDGRTVQILDVEQILTDIAPGKDAETDAGIVDGRLSNKHVLFADDSSVARTQIRKTLERLGVTYRQCTTGREAWEELQEIAGQAEQDRVPLRDRLHLVLSDIEMPEMDGFTLTRMIRSDARFDGIHVILHSSLTGTCNTEKGRSVGASDFVTKFDPRLLKEKLQRYC
jgi:two-component system chemotaxis response regulator CheV